jgi:signal transduction histidine kinase
MMAIREQSIEQQLERRVFHLETLQRLGREIYALRAIRPILKTAAAILCDTLGIARVAVCLAKRRRRVPIMVLCAGFEDQAALEQAITGLPLSMWEIRDRQRVRLLEDEGEAGEGLLRHGVRIWLPLHIDRDNLVGIGLGEMPLGVFPADDIPFLTTTCEQTEVALKNAHLYQHLQRVSTKRREEIRRSEALYRIDLLSTTVFDPHRLVEDMLTVLLDWVEEKSGRLCLPFGSSGEWVAASRDMPADEAPAAHLGRIEEDVQRRGGGALVTLEPASDHTPARYALCLAVGSRKRRQKSGTLLVTGGEGLQRVYKNRMHTLTAILDQMMTAIEHNRLEAENKALEVANRQIQEANRLKSRFLANMSHELRTPLNAIIAMSDILLEQYFGPLNERQADYLKDIHESGQHLLSLINDILDLSKVEAGHSPLELSEVDMGTLLESSLTIVRERASIHHIGLFCEVPDDLPLITADERKVKQVVFNLLSNAVKFTPDNGRVGVRARLADGALEVCVWDTGIGIAREDHDKIFGEFEQSESALTRQYEGTGLGLALVKRFVEQHQGRVWVISDLGQGSAFYFTLPLRQAPDMPDGGRP